MGESIRPQAPIEIWPLQSILRVLADVDLLGIDAAAQKHGCPVYTIRRWNKAIWAAKAKAASGQKPVTLPKINLSKISELEAEVDRLKREKNEALDRVALANKTLSQMRDLAATQC